jgi:hypothetical protein
VPYHSNTSTSSKKKAALPLDRSAPGGGERNFPAMLHWMISNVEVDNLDTEDGNSWCSIVSWQPHGRCFLVHDQKKFVEHILPL